MRKAADRLRRARTHTADGSYEDAVRTARLALDYVRRAVPHDPKVFSVNPRQRTLEQRWDMQGYAVSNLGVAESQQGRHHGAVRHHLQGLGLLLRHKDRAWPAQVLNGLAETMLGMGKPCMARRYHAAALAQSRRSGGRDPQARAFHGIAHAFLAMGESGHARQYLSQALDIYTALRSAEASRIRAELRACQP